MSGIPSSPDASRQRTVRCILFIPGLSLWASRRLRLDFEWQRGSKGRQALILCFAWLRLAIETQRGWLLPPRSPSFVLPDVFGGMDDQAVDALLRDLLDQAIRWHADYENNFPKLEPTP